MKETRKNMKEKLVKIKKSIRAAIITYIVIAINQTCVYANANVNQITQPLTNLRTLMVAIVAGIGGILVVKAILEIANAYQQQDSSGMSAGLKQLVAGILMASVSVVLIILGV